MIINSMETNKRDREQEIEREREREFLPLYLIYRTLYIQTLYKFKINQL